MGETRVDDRELLALLSLLETESGSSLSVLIEQMRSFSDARLDRLAAIAPPGSTAHTHLNLLLAQREAPQVQAAFLEWLAQGADLERGALLIARAGYPRTDTAAVGGTLDALADEVRPHLPTDEAGKLRRLIRFLHEEKGFRGNDRDYYDPDNSYVNRVLERHTGLPITLSILYILLGKRLGLQIGGVALPGHFVASMVTSATTLFFDPYHSGRLLNQEDIATIVRSSGPLVIHPGYLSPASPRDIVQRMLRNLVHAYDEREDLERAELMRQYLSLLG